MLTGPGSSNNSESATSAPQTGCPKGDAERRLLMTVAVLGPVLALAAKSIRRVGTLVPYLPKPHDPHKLHTSILSWEVAVGQGLVIKSRRRGCPPPALLKLLRDHVPSVVVLSPGEGTRTAGAGAGKAPGDLRRPKGRSSRGLVLRPFLKSVEVSPV